jgi:uncharacterized protein
VAAERGDGVCMMNVPPDFHQRLALRGRPAGFPVMRQRWSGLLFLHWEVDPALIAERLPPGLHVDTFGGRAWLGVVPFFMDRVRPVGLPPVPWLSWFMELNVRTYVHDGRGNAGVWFFSLDCNQPLAVEIARRSFHLPYEHAVMRSEITGNRIEYHSRRKSAGALDAEFVYQTPQVTREAESESLEWFLVERYLLFAANRAGHLFTGRVHHPPYQIAPGGCEGFSAEPIRLNGFPVPEGAPSSVLTATPVDVRIHPLRQHAP